MFGATTPARAAAPGARSATALQNIQSAGRQAGTIPISRFARGRRLALLNAARRAARLARTKRTCAALAAADVFLNSLGAPNTWRGSRIPRGLVRRPLALLTLAERALLRRAGSRCARPVATRRLVSHQGGSGFPKVAPPNISPGQGEGVLKPIPLGRLIRPKSIGGGSALGADRHGLAVNTPASNPFATIASTPLSFFRNSDVGVVPFRGSPTEPTAAIAPNVGVGWYTGNTWDGLSTDNGRTWTRFDPSSVLPDQGLAYCCDQLVSYSPSYNVFVWVSQYWCSKSCLVSDNQNPPHNVCRSDGVYNRIRIAVATPQALRANATNPGAAWTYWDVTPGLIGQPGNAWFDRSDLSVNPWNMNWGVDIICGNAGNLLARISLAQLAARGTVTLSYITDNGARTAAQGLGTTTTYFTGANSLSQARIWSWAPFSGTLFRHDINHSSVPIFDNAINGTDGGNWYDRYGIFPGEVESSTVSGNILYLAQGTGRAYCTANCSTSTPTLNHVFNEPAILITKFDTNTWSEVGERWIWNPTLAFGWPALQTDGAGDVGLAFRTSADNQNAQPVAGFLTPSEQFYYADPAGGPFETGDYYSLRPGRTSQSLVMTAETVQNDPSGPNMHWFYIEYGLGAPPYVSPPSVHITAPANLASFTQGTSVSYSADVSDPIDGTLPSGAIVWTEDGSQIGTGSGISHTEGTVGLHTIKVTATNGDGKSASDQITIRVLAPVPPGSPSVSITSPSDGQTFCPSSFPDGSYGANVQFQATASDPSTPPLALSYSWTDSVDGAPATQVSTQLSPKLFLSYNSPGPRTTHDLTLTATNSAGKSNSAQVRVYIPSVCIY
ncbi:MAG TPA: PKD domain-containing protein [Solirubrobacteraceae bacterium]